MVIKLCNHMRFFKFFFFWCLKLAGRFQFHDQSIFWMLAECLPKYESLGLILRFSFVVIVLEWRLAFIQCLIALQYLHTRDQMFFDWLSIWKAEIRYANVRVNNFHAFGAQSLCFQIIRKFVSHVKVRIVIYQTCSASAVVMQPFGLRAFMHAAICFLKKINDLASYTLLGGTVSCKVWTQYVEFWKLFLQVESMIQ